MKDIRSELRERLNQAEAMRAEIDSKRKAISEEIDVLMRLLEIEQGKFGVDSAPEDSLIPLADALIEMAKNDALAKDEMYRRAEKRGYFKNTQRGRQSIHATVINLVKSGRMEEIGDGLFIAKMKLTGQSAKTEPVN